MNRGAHSSMSWKKVTFRPIEISLTEPDIPNSMRGWSNMLGNHEGPPTFTYDKGVRLIWRDLEPIEGQYDFTKIEEVLNAAKAAGGRGHIRFRAVATSGIGVPDYMMNLMPKGFWFDWDHDGKEDTYCPDFNEPAFLSRAEALLQAIGAVYDKDERVGIIDIGMYGRWGEWHMAGISYPTASGAESATDATKIAIVDMHLQAFPSIRLVSMTDDLVALQYAMDVSDQIGWRRDSMGVMWFQDPVRMEMVKGRWRTAPVFGEPIGTRQPGSLDYYNRLALQALELHVSLINAINTFNPNKTYSDEEISAAAAAGKHSGFRLLVDLIMLPRTITSGLAFDMTVNWRNRGSAPLYERWDIVYQLKDDQGECVWEGKSEQDLRNLLPTFDAPACRRETFTLPKDIPSGSYELSVLIRDRETTYRAPLALALKGRASDGSYPLGMVEVDAWEGGEGR